MRKRSKYRPKGVILNPIGYVLESMTPVAKHDSYLLDLKIKNSEAMVALTHGKATKTDIDTLIAMSNIVEALSKLGFGSEYGEIAIAGREALLGLVHRAVDKLKFLPTGTEIKALQDLMDLHDAQMEVITVKDMDRALEYAKTQFRQRKVTLLPRVPEELT